MTATCRLEFYQRDRSVADVVAEYLPVFSWLGASFCFIFLLALQPPAAVTMVTSMVTMVTIVGSSIEVGGRVEVLASFSAVF